MGNWVNWLLVIVGVLCAAAELALGALTGFDLALVGASLAAGGVIGASRDGGSDGDVGAGPEFGEQDCEPGVEHHGQKRNASSTDPPHCRQSTSGTAPPSD